MPPSDATPKPALVATLAIGILALLAFAGVYLLMGPLPDGFDRPALTDVLAVMASVIAPIVSIAAAYYGITIALKSTSDSRRAMKRATNASLEAADSFTTAITNITIDLHNQNLQLIEALQRGGAFAVMRQHDAQDRTDAADTGEQATVDTPRPRPASQHANTSSIGLPGDPA